MNNVANALELDKELDLEARDVRVREHAPAPIGSCDALHATYPVDVKAPASAFKYVGDRASKVGH